MAKTLDIVLERLARRIAAQTYNEAHDVERVWNSYLPEARAAYDELNKIDEERAIAHA